MDEKLKVARAAADAKMRELMPERVRPLFDALAATNPDDCPLLCGLVAAGLMAESIVNSDMRQKLGRMVASAMELATVAWLADQAAQKMGN